MKTKLLLLAALVGAASMSAQAGVRLGISLPLPLVVTTPVVVAAPVAPAPAVIVETVPACPGVNYVWTAGYWSGRPDGYTWVRGCWNYRPAHVVYGHYYADRFHGGHRW